MKKPNYFFNRPTSQRVKFLEYDTNLPDQHFMTIMVGKNIIIGRGYRKYDTESKKMIYTAKDAQGTPIYMDEQTLSGIKKRFIQAQKEIKSPEQDLDESLETPLKFSECNKPQEREDELKKQRALNNNPEKQNEISR